MKFKIQLIDIGRNDHCEIYEQEADSLYEIANLVYKKCNQFLMSSNTCLEQDNNQKTHYIMFAGFRPVGRAIIEELKGGLK